MAIPMLSPEQLQLLQGQPQAPSQQTTVPTPQPQDAMPRDASGTPLSPDMGGLQPAINPSRPDNAQAPSAPAPEKYGIIKRMLTSFVYNGSQALKASQGLPTDYEIQKQNTVQAHIKAQTDLLNQQAEQLKTLVPMIGADGKPVINPYTGQPTLIPQAYQKGAQGSMITAGARQSIADNRNTTQTSIAQQKEIADMAKNGMKPNPNFGQPGESQWSPMELSEMSPNLQAGVALKNSMKALADARASGVPAQIKIAQARANAAMIQAGAAQQNAGTNAYKAGLGQGPAGIAAGGGDVTNTPQFRLLSPGAQKTLMETEPTKQQMDQIIKIFEPMKDDNTPGKFFADRLKYAAGIQSDIGTASDAIAQLELNKVAGAARILKGSSRAIQALQQAEKHLPNVWVDSPKMIYSKAVMIKNALDDIEKAAYTYGSKTGVTPQGPDGSTPPANGVAPKTAGDYLSKFGKK